jgi:hypothetical protein
MKREVREKSHDNLCTVLDYKGENMSEVRDGGRGNERKNSRTKESFNER